MEGHKIDAIQLNFKGFVGTAGESDEGISCD